jgi:hypothetical protein
MGCQQYLPTRGSTMVFPPWGPQLDHQKGRPNGVPQVGSPREYDMWWPTRMGPQVSTRRGPPIPVPQRLSTKVEVSQGDPEWGSTKRISPKWPQSAFNMADPIRGVPQAAFPKRGQPSWFPRWGLKLGVSQGGYHKGDHSRGFPKGWPRRGFLQSRSTKWGP